MTNAKSYHDFNSQARSTDQVLQHCPSRSWEGHEEKAQEQTELLLQQQWFLPQLIHLTLLSAKHFKEVLPCSIKPERISLELTH